jgi:hypothetical protein
LTNVPPLQQQPVIQAIFTETSQEKLRV